MLSSDDLAERVRVRREALVGGRPLTRTRIVDRLLHISAGRGAVHILEPAEELRVDAFESGRLGPARPGRMSGVEGRSVLGVSVGRKGVEEVHRFGSTFHGDTATQLQCASCVKVPQGKRACLQRPAADPDRMLRQGLAPVSTYGPAGVGRATLAHSAIHVREATVEHWDYFLGEEEVDEDEWRGRLRAPPDAPLDRVQLTPGGLLEPHRGALHTGARLVSFMVRRARRVPYHRRRGSRIPKRPGRRGRRTARRPSRGGSRRRRSAARTPRPRLPRRWS